MIAKPQNTSQQALGFRWDDIRVVLALAREGTLTGAGALLGINASTVGRRLEAFEEATGAKFFDRTPDGVLPTDALEQLLPHARELEHAAAEVSRAVEGFEREPEGVVRITAPPGVAHLFVAPILVELHERYPKLRIELDASIDYADLTRREADIALRVSRPSSGDLVAVRIGDEPESILTGECYAAELGKLRDFDDARWIDWGRDLANIPSARWVAENVSPDRVILRSSNITSQLEAARTGLGVVLSPAIVGRVAGLVEVEVTRALRKKLDAAPRESLWLVGHRALRNVPRIAAVWEFLVERVGSL